jgi:hypothetical protein
LCSRWSNPRRGFEARALGFSIYAEAETLESLRNEVRDAVQCHSTRPNDRRLSASTSFETTA